MKYRQTIITEFSKNVMKTARNWDDLSYDEQRGYLSRHPKSKRRITARPSKHQHVAPSEDKFTPQYDFMELFGERYQKLLEDFKPTIEKAFEDGKIYNPKFKRIKEIISNAIWNLAPVQAGENTRKMGPSGFMLKLRDDYGLSKTHPLWTKMYYDGSFSNAHEFKSAKKRLNKIRSKLTTVPEWFDKYLETIEPIQQAADLLDNLKPMVVKGREPKSEEERKKQKNYFEKKHVPQETLKEVKNTIREFAKKSHTNLKKTYNDMLSNTLDSFEMARKPGQSPNQYSSAKFKASYAKAHKTDLTPKELQEIEYYENKRSFRNEDIYFLTRLYEQKKIGEGYQLVPDYEAKVSAAAKQMADDLVAIFVEKNTDKVASVIADKKITKSRTANIQTGRGMLEGDMFFEFADDTKFRVHNKIVFVMNEQGTLFNRFPTTFHDITDSSGKVYRMKSEKWMNEKFK